jgi:hypothetical protein
MSSGQNGAVKLNTDSSSEMSFARPSDVLPSGPVNQFELDVRTDLHVGVRLEEKLRIGIALSIQNDSGEKGNIDRK